MNTPTTESLTLQEQGQQLSVLGAFANSEQFQMATQAAELALALAEKRPVPEITHVFNPTLVRRHSVSTLTEPGNSSSND